MTQSRLVACPSCARHVRVSETACPFCGSVLPDSLREGVPPQPPRVRLTRAALFAFGTGTLALAPACSSSSAPDTSVFIPPYGIPPIPDAAGNDGAIDDATVGVDSAYGLPAIDYDATEGDAGDGRATSLGDAADGGPVDEAGSDSGHD